MKLNHLCALALTCLALQPCAAQTTQKLSASKANEYALIYTLPLTVVDITIEAEHTECAPGEFYNYAKRQLGINNAITEASEQVTIKSVTLTPRGVPNTANRWQVQFKAGATPYILLNEAGCPVAVNTDTPAAVAEVKLPVAVAATPTALETEAARQAVTQEMTRSSSTSKRAELAAQRIFELRETRSDILSGQADNAPADGQAMQLVLDNLSAQEAALTAMFAGTTKTYTTVSTVTFEPDSADVYNKIIARLSATKGVVDSDDLSGAPITLSMSILDEGKLPVNEKGEAKRFPKGGFAYNIPGTALFTISYNGREYLAQEVSLAQLGTTFGIDPALFADKKEPSKVLLSPTTGAITLLGPAE
jgi:hypothetical protein